MQRSLLLTLLLLCGSHLFFSCSDKTDTVYTYTVQKQDYRTQVSTEGVVKAVQSRTLMAPSGIWDCVIEYIAEHGTNVNIGDTIAILSSINLASNQESLLKEIANKEASFNKRKAQIAMDIAVLEAQEKNNRAETSIIELDSSQMKYASLSDQKILKLELERAHIERARILKKLSATRLIGEVELKKNELQLNKKRVRLSMVEKKMNDLYVIAPLQGIVLRSISDATNELLSEGDQLYMGMALAEIPDLSESQIELKIYEDQFKKVTMGDTVDVVVEGFGKDTIQGHLSHISKMGKAKSRKSKIKVFDATVSLDNISQYPKPELTAKCNIYSNVFLDTIVVPSFAVFKEDSLKFVYKKEAQHFIRQQVYIATSNETHCMIAAGLQPGDELAMSKPSQRIIKGEMQQLLPPDTLNVTPHPPDK